MKTSAERRLVTAIQTAFAESGRILVVCRGSRAEAITQAEPLGIELTPYGSAKLDQSWWTASRSQKINIAVWLLMTGSLVVFHGDV